MLDQFIALLRAWDRKYATIRHLRDLDDRLLADMGIPRDSIAAVAAQAVDDTTPPTKPARPASALACAPEL